MIPDIFIFFFYSFYTNGPMHVFKLTQLFKNSSICFAEVGVDPLVYVWIFFIKKFKKLLIRFH